MLTIELLMNSSEIIEDDMTLEINEYDDGESCYTIDPDDEGNETYTIRTYS
jgi:hypothetical protein